MSSLSSSALPVHARRPLVLADLVPDTLVRNVVLVIGGAALTGLLAQVSIPLPGTPVPLTLQTFGALTVGMALGWQRGLAALTLYLAAGVAGVPWFADHESGLALASFGYIIGFALAAGLVGALARRGGDRTPLVTIGTMLLGNAVIYAVGVPWLAAYAHLDAGQAIAAGLTPFLLTDGLKTLLAAGCLPSVWRLVDRAHHR